MDIKELDRMAKNKVKPKVRLKIHEYSYYTAMKGLYALYKLGEISETEAEEDKEVLVDVYEAFRKQEVHQLNKAKLKDAIILELGRYLSCGMTNADREKAYPRKLFEERIGKVIDHAYGAS